MYEDERAFAGNLTIDTPEQVGVELPIAGVGSRVLAMLADTLLQLLVALLLGLIVFVVLASAPALKHAVGRLATASDTVQKWVVALAILGQFLLLWGYFALFEAFWNGQTPGKRWLKIRVLSESGRPITFFEALARNLLRVVDFLPSLYLAGIVTMLCNQRSQRLGDLLAGTLVVHETRGAAEPVRLGATIPWQGNAAAAVPASVGAGSPVAPADALARLSSKERQVLETFFARNIDLPLDVRERMAARLAGEMTQRMQWSPGAEILAKPERFLEALLLALRDRR